MRGFTVDGRFCNGRRFPVLFADGNNRIPPISIRSQFTEPGFNSEIDYDLVDLNGSHRFSALNADWIARGGFQSQENDFFSQAISAGGAPFSLQQGKQYEVGLKPAP